MKAPPRILVIGSCNVDLTTYSKEFPKGGETIFGEGFDLGFGGKGANQAVAAALCGARVEMVGRVGDDLFGEATVRNFQERGVGTSHLKILAGESSGTAAILVEPGGQNRIIVVKGANDRLLPSDVDAAAAVLEGADCLLLQLEVPIETVYHCIALASRLGVRCILNPAPGLPLDMSRVRGVDYFIPNESEAEAAGGIPVANPSQAQDCARSLRQQGVERVILTLGEKGAWISSGDEEHLEPGFSVNPIDTTGAGDAFIGSFAVFVSEGDSDREAVRKANLYAALSTEHKGTQKSFPTRQRFQDQWRRRVLEPGS